MPEATKSTAPLRRFEVFVRGLPIPQGSSRAFRNKRTGQPITVTKTGNLVAWRHAIQTVLSFYWDGAPIDGPVALSLIFIFPRVKSAPKRVFHIVTPDEDKLCQAALDAMTGVAFTDDARVFAPTPLGIYGDEPGVHIFLRELGETAEALRAFRLECADREFDAVKGARA